MTFCDTTAEIGASFRTHGHTDGGRTDRCDSWNSYLDYLDNYIFVDSKNDEIQEQYIDILHRMSYKY